MGSLSLLQEVFPTQGSDPGLLHCRWILYQLTHKGSPGILEWNLPDPGIELGSPALQADSLPTELSGKPLWHKAKRKSPLIQVKGESEKAGLKFNIQKTKIMASSPITSWQIDGKTMETVTDFIFLDSKITADGDFSHEIQTLAPWKKIYVQPRHHIKKQGQYFANKGPSSQSCGFSSSHVWM